MGALESFESQPAVLPPGLEDGIQFEEIETVELLEAPVIPQSIAGFICRIDYTNAKGEATNRVIQCRSIKVQDRVAMVGAICVSSHAHKHFRCDRISEVFDALTGESLGNGSFFKQFVVGEHKQSKSNWNTTSQRKSLIVAGLNVLSFMARCDGRWHPLEEQVIEDFVCALWLKKGWENSPPMDEVLAHARRLAPDGTVFRSAIRQYAHSNGSGQVLSRFVQRIIAADGVICDEEHRWATEFADALEEARAEERVDRTRTRMHGRSGGRSAVAVIEIVLCPSLAGMAADAEGSFARFEHFDGGAGPAIAYELSDWINDDDHIFGFSTDHDRLVAIPKDHIRNWQGWA